MSTNVFDILEALGVETDAKRKPLDQTPTPNGVASLKKDVFPPGSVLTVFFRLYFSCSALR